MNSSRQWESSDGWWCVGKGSFVMPDKELGSGERVGPVCRRPSPYRRMTSAIQFLKYRIYLYIYTHTRPGTGPGLPPLPCLWVFREFYTPSMGVDNASPFVPSLCCLPTHLDATKGALRATIVGWVGGCRYVWKSTNQSKHSLHCILFRSSNRLI